MRFGPGSVLGSFEILTPLGSGGMGEVYRARDTRLDRIVAIKLLPSDLISGHSRKVERFRHEARAIARITHPNICTLHDVGEDGASIFLVMEHVDGVTLARRLEDGPLPMALALRTAIGIADALDHAHRHGVVHRDLTPGNVMLTRDRVKLLDFGLAKLKERDEQALRAPTESARLTDAGSIVGTIPYMAPEQVEGRDVDPRTDIFAFGVVLYEMLAGRRPFTGDSRASVMAAIVALEPQPLSALTEVPDALERLIARCLAKDPEDRWQTARDLAAELKWVAATGSVPATVPRILRPSRRAVLWGGVAGAALSGLAFGATGGWLRREPTVPTFLPVTGRKGAVSAARFTSDGRFFVYSASWDGQPYALFQGGPTGPDARDFSLQHARILSISSAGDMAVLFGPQNITHTFGERGERTLARIPIAGRARRDLYTDVVDADWIPGTDTLAVIRDPGGDGRWTVEFPAGNVVHEADAAWSLRVSPDGRRVAFFEGPAQFESPPTGMITVIERSGDKETISKNWAGTGLAWASDTEVWFTATRPGQGAPHLNAASLSGVERTIYRAPDWLVLHDISAAGRVLLSRNSIRIAMSCRGPGDAGERDLTWQLASSVRALSTDGAILIFEDELGAAPSGNPRLFRRSMDASPAVPIGEGVGGTLSPDGRWVLARSGEHLVLLPMGADPMVTLSKGSVQRIENWAWLDSMRIVFTGYSGNGQPKGYLQELPSGLPRGFTPDGVVLAGKAAPRDEHTVLGQEGDRWRLFPVYGGIPLPVHALTPEDLPIQWSHDGRFVYTVVRPHRERARSSAVPVFRVELTTGDRPLWKTLTPSDPVGVEDARETVVITPDARSYCYTYLRRLGDLFVVDGLS
jgi:hypothetical protein